MEIKYGVEKNILYIYLYGEIDEYSSGKCRSKTDEIIDRCTGVKNVVFNFANVTFMDSTGIGMLIGRYKKIKSYNIAAFVQNPPSNVQKIMQISGLYKILPII